MNWSNTGWDRVNLVGPLAPPELADLDNRNATTVRSTQPICEPVRHDHVGGKSSRPDVDYQVACCITFEDHIDANIARGGIQTKDGIAASYERCNYQYARSSAIAPDETLPNLNFRICLSSPSARTRPRGQRLKSIQPTCTLST
jgi:hypothetical protein